MRNLAGDAFPQAHERHYVACGRDDGDDTFFPAVVLPGSDQAAFDYDAVALLV